MEKSINKYFPGLQQEMSNKFDSLFDLYQAWNSKINVISRKDFDNFYIHHVLHSLAIAKFIQFPKGSTIMDLGTGGGFPGVPLAIMFPEAHFFLSDSIGKKIFVVNEIINELNLKNVEARQIRAENIDRTFDFIVTRAVADLNSLLDWSWCRCTKGLIALKGGNVDNEISAIPNSMGIKKDKIDVKGIDEWFDEEFFKEKKIIYIGK